jgi:uncharacterized protein (UPF0332 family)
VSFDWAKYLVLAKELSSDPTEEKQRSAISRAYYAVFGIALGHLRTRGYVFSATGEAHTLVWQKFLYARRECRKLGIIGDRLRKRRTKADYDLDFSNLLKETETAIADADDFFKEFDRVGKGCP